MVLNEDNVRDVETMEEWKEFLDQVIFTDNCFQSKIISLVAIFEIEFFLGEPKYEISMNFLIISLNSHICFSWKNHPVKACVCL